MDNFVEVKNLTKVFPGGLKAVDNISFTAKKGEFLSLLGPSGCGKTTTLRCIAGLEKPDRGEIVVDGTPYYSGMQKIAVPIHKRNIGMVFQSYAVWPHMKVFDNVAYGLRMHKVGKHEIKRKVEEVLELVGLQGLADRQSTKLSGGQQQRIAVARALVYNPKLLLFDEPLSNLDAKLRERMRLELIRLQREIGITSIYVTHDQVEAMVISHKVIVMHNGKIMQIGDAKAIYNKPQNRFVADFIGIANFLNGEVTRKPDDREEYGMVKISDGTRNYEINCIIPEEIQQGNYITLSFRPENTKLIFNPAGTKNKTLPGKVSNLMYLGNYIDCRIQFGKYEIRAQISPEENIKENEDIFMEIDPKYSVCIPSGS